MARSPSDTTGAVIAVSRTFFRRDYRLSIGAAIHRLGGTGFTCQELADDLGIKYNRIYDELQRLQGADLIAEVPDDRQSITYKATPTVFWEMCQRLLEEVLAVSPSDV